MAFLDRIFRISEAPGDRFKSTNGRDWIALDGDLRAAARNFFEKGAVGLQAEDILFKQSKACPQICPPM